MIHSFLSDRSMRVRVNKTMSDALKIKDGSPQGTLLGNLLFTLTTDMIEVDQNATNVPCQVVEIPRDQIAPCIDLEYLASTPIGVERTLSRLSEISDIHEHAYLRRTERILRYEMIFSDTDDTLLSRNGSYWEKEVPPPGHRKKRELISVKFIDDLTTASMSYLPASYQIFSQNKPGRIIHAKACEDFYNTVSLNAAELGLMVNLRKTQLMCVNATIGSDVTSYVQIDGERLTSQNSIKILGFHINKKADMTDQVEQLKKKFRERAWVIRNLKRSGLEATDLIKCIKLLCAQ